MSRDLSAKAIESTEFSTALRGYDKDEVDRFLSLVAAEHRRLSEAARRPQETAEKPYHRLGADVGDLLQNAQDAAERLTTRAEEDAARIREEADKAAKEIRAKAKKDAEETAKAAEYEAKKRLEVAQLRADELRREEQVLQERLDDVRARLRGALEQLGPAEKEDVPESGAEAVLTEERPADAGDDNRSSKVVVIEAESEQAPVS